MTKLTTLLFEELNASKLAKLSELKASFALLVPKGSSRKYKNQNLIFNNLKII